VISKIVYVAARPVEALQDNIRLVPQQVDRHM
jgi:hypothetical protein